jgi:type IV pilus assembly protein PilP
MNMIRILLLLVAATLLSSCARDMSDLERWVAEMKQRPAARIDPLPQVQPYETFVYAAHDRRAPFIPDSAVARQASAGAGGGLQPDFDRPREYLEEFPLDSLRMVGTINMNNAMYGLISTTDGAVHRVRIGEYLGQNHGRITAISETRIDLTEIIPDGTGGWTERRAGVALSE